MEKFLRAMDRSRLRIGLSLIALNLLATSLLVYLVLFGSERPLSIDWVDFSVEGFSSVTYFLLFALAIFSRFRSDVRVAFITGTFIIQCGRIIDSADEIAKFDWIYWSVVGDGLTLIGELLIVFAALRWVVISNRQVNSDPLTALFNRRYHEDELERMLERVRTGGDSFATVSVDLDHFKSINDTYGHAVGDASLQHTACMLRATCRQVDVISRVGGEEFEVLIPNCDRGQAIMIAERIRSALDNNPPPGLERLTASFGVAVSRPTDSLGSLRNRADAGVYKSKAEGRNRVTFVDT